MKELIIQGKSQARTKGLKEAVLLVMLTLSSLAIGQKVYYVAPNGSDSNPGTISAPWKTWGKAFNASLSPGDTVYFRGGVYVKDMSEGQDSWYYPGRSSNGTGYKIATSGTESKNIVFSNYRNEEPILDCGKVVAKNNLNYGIRTGPVSHVKLRGLTIRNVWAVEGGVNGASVECIGLNFGNTGMIIENCNVYNIHGIGYKIEGAKNAKVINCDAWNCCDSLAVGVQKPGERGTGFSQGNMGSLSASSYFYGCRAWNCSDQGFSTYDVGFVEYNSCWAFNNGDLEADGSGFKLGFTANVGGLSGNKRQVVNCIAAYNRMAGFNQNCNGRETVPMQLFNNVAYRNGYGTKGVGGFGFIFFKTTGTEAQEKQQILKNNVAYQNQTNDFRVNSGAYVTDSNNDWNLGLNVGDKDFLALDASTPSGVSKSNYSSVLGASRKADGSLPDINFLKPSAGSVLIDKGVDVGLPYKGSAPDLGYAEHENVSSVPPTAVFTASPNPGTVGEIIIFDASKSSDDQSITKYEWEFGDGTSGTGLKAEHSYTAAGTYNVTLKVTDNTGNTDTETVKVIINLPTNIPPIASFTASPNPGSVGEAIAFDASGSSDDQSIDKYEWNFGDGTSGTGLKAEHSYAAAGSYSVTLTVTDNNGNTATETVNIVINQPANIPPVAAFTASPNPGIVGEAVSFDATQSGDDQYISQYEWTFGDGTTSTGQTVQHTFDAVGTYDVKLTVTDNNGSTDSETISVYINLPTNIAPTAAYTATPNPGIAGEAVSFDASQSSDDQSITQYEWTFGDGISATGQTAQHTYTAAGTYNTTLTVTDNNGNTDAEMVNVIINLPTNVPPVAAFTAVPNPGIVGEVVSFDASQSSDDQSITRYEWAFGDGASATGLTTQHTYPAAGSYDVTLTVTDNNGNTDTETVRVNINLPTTIPPVAAFTATPNPGIIGETVSFDASQSSDDQSITRYEWTFGDGASATGLATQHTYSAAGSYDVTLTLTDNDGNTATEMVRVNINQPTTIPPTAAFTASPNPGIVGEAISFDASQSSDDQSIVQYEWIFGDGTTGTGLTAQHTYAAAGTYHVTLTATDNDGNKDSEMITVTVNLPINIVPTATFTVTPNPGFVGEAVNFDASQSSDDQSITSYEWAFGDGASATGKTVQHTFASADNYLVTLTVTDNEGNKDSETVNVIINLPTTIPPVAAFTASPNPGVVGEAVNFDASKSSDDQSINGYEWAFGDGTSATGLTAQHTYPVSGNYDVILTVTDNNGNTDTETVRVNINLPTTIPPVSAFTATPNPGLVGEAISFDASLSSDDQSITRFEWAFGDGASATGVNVQHTYSAVGSYDVTLTLTDNDGNTATETVGVNINLPTTIPPVPAFKATPNPGIVGEAISFDASLSSDDQSITRFEWAFGDGASATGVNVQHTYSAAGSYDVTLTLTDNDGNTASETVGVNINLPTTIAPVPAFTATPNPGIVGETISFDASQSSDDQSITRYEWAFGDGASATGVNVQHTYSAAGSYDVTLTLTDNDGNTATKTVGVNINLPTTIAPVPAFTATPNPGIVGEAVSFDASQSSDDQSITRYEWTFGDGSVGTGRTVNHTYSIAGIYNVTLTVTDNDGNKDSDNSSLTINDGEPVLSFNVLGTYPNPTIDVVTIEFSCPNDGYLPIEVKDDNNRTLIREQYMAHKGNNKVSINVSSLKSGEYSIFISDGGNNIVTDISKQQFIQ